MIQVQNMKVVRVLDVPRAAATSVASATFDALGYDYATIVVSLSSELNTNATGAVLSLSAADTSNATNFATVTADSSAIDATAATGYVQHVDLKTKKRYLKLTLTPATTTNDLMAYSAIALMTRAEQAPSSTTGMVGNTSDTVVIVS